MKKVQKTISKSKIIEAIRTESLIRREFVEVNDYKEPVKNPNCTVCAVGAVLRNSGRTNKQIYRYGKKLLMQGVCSASDAYIEEAINKAIKQKRWLHSLSLEFEGLSRYLSIDHVIFNLIEFIEEKFPDRIRL